jgi:hypothetical protein
VQADRSTSCWEARPASINVRNDAGSRRCEPVLHDDVADEPTHGGRHRHAVKVTGFDLREVEHFADHAEQRARGARRDIHEPALLAA